MGLQLLYTERSPYARKVRAVAFEKQIHLKLVECNPFDQSDELLIRNPAAKIPVLMLENGRSILDSPVICEYLDGQGTGIKLIPDNIDERFDVLTLAAIADGILDAAVSCILESMRPQENIYQGLYDKQRVSIERSLRYLDAHTSHIHKLSLASIATACAIDYIENRLAGVGVQVDWRGDCPDLLEWFERFMQRKCMQTTAPASWDRMTAA